MALKFTPLILIPRTRNAYLIWILIHFFPNAHPASGVQSCILWCVYNSWTHTTYSLYLFSCRPDHMFHTVHLSRQSVTPWWRFHYSSYQVAAMQQQEKGKVSSWEERRGQLWMNRMGQIWCREEDPFRTVPSPSLEFTSQIKDYFTDWHNAVRELPNTIYLHCLDLDAYGSEGYLVYVCQCRHWV